MDSESKVDPWKSKARRTAPIKLQLINLDNMIVIDEIIFYLKHNLSHLRYTYITFKFT